MVNASFVAPPLGALRDSGIVAILRGSSCDRARPVVEALVDAGVTAVEFTMTTPGALEALADLRAAMPAVQFGVGTVLDAATARRSIEAGATFIVTPTLEEDVLQVSVEQSIPAVIGAMTPTEAHRAARLGASAVKIFPVSALGGVEYIRALRGPFPDLPLVPTGGIDLDDVGRYLRAGCVSVGLGSPLVGDALEGGSLTALGERARRAVGQAESAR